MISTNPKIIFSYTKSQRQNNDFPAAMFFKNRSSVNLVVISNLFADYFSSIYTPHNSTFQINNIINNHSYFELNEAEVERTVLSIHKFKTNSPDNIPILFYKRTVHHIKTPLIILFKSSLHLM